MARFTVRIKTDGAAFFDPVDQEQPTGHEVAAILRRLATIAENAEPPNGGRLFDVNGAECGDWRWTRR